MRLCPASSGLLWSRALKTSIQAFIVMMTASLATVTQAQSPYVFSYGGTISATAGNGTQGYSGDGGFATSATLNTPLGIAVDSAGNIYFADGGNSVIRKITVGTGNISTVAGNGTAGYSGDNGYATSAELNNPCSVALDASGNLYIADTSNNVIREVSVTTGVITTVAGNGGAGYWGDGGIATSAGLNQPNDVKVDGAGNIYIADSGNSRIRKVDHSSHNISTIAGDGNWNFSGDGGQATSAERSIQMRLHLTPPATFTSPIGQFPKCARSLCPPASSAHLRVTDHPDTRVMEVQQQAPN